MNENINLVRILRRVPKGTKLWSPIWGAVIFVGIDETDPRPIQCKKFKGDGDFSIRDDGHLTFYKDAECILFPSKENRDWSTFNVAKHKTFKPFQKVLVKVTNDDDNHVWVASIYSHYNESKGRHYFSNLQWTDDDSGIIPFEGNEDKLGKIAE